MLLFTSSNLLCLILSSEFHVLEICPDIIDGPLYGSFHGIIQLAYGLVSNCDQAVLEGITLMDQQYSPLFLDDRHNPKVP